MKFSVIIPVYNAEKDLCQCIDSILNQNHDDFELLLVNDGSLDSSGAICDKYAKTDSRVKVFHNKNMGASAARNYGISKAEGEYIVFVDADDYVSSDYLSEFAKYDADCIVCGFKAFDGLDFVQVPKTYGYSGPQEIINYIEGDLWASYLRAPWAKAIKRELVVSNDIKFTPELTFAEDALFCMDCFFHCQTLQMIDMIGYFYKAHENIYVRYNVDFTEYNSFLKSLSDICLRSGSDIDFRKGKRKLISIEKTAYFEGYRKRSFIKGLQESFFYMFNGVCRKECHTNIKSELRACAEMLLLPFRRVLNIK